jgi:hypothetical protein
MNISAWSFKSHTANISLKETFHITVSVVSLACIEASLQTLVAAVNSSFTHAADCLIVVPPRDVAHVTKGGWLRLISAIIPYSSEIQLHSLTHQRGFGTNGTLNSSSLVYTHASILLFLHRRRESRVFIDKEDLHFLRAANTFRIPISPQIYTSPSCRHRSITEVIMAMIPRKGIALFNVCHVQWRD